MDVVQTSIDALSVGSLYALFALGVALLFGVLRLVNFAHGDYMMCSAYAVVLTDDLPLPLRIVAALVAAAAVALAADLLVFARLRRASWMTLLVASFAVSLLLQSGVRLLLGTAPRSSDVGAWTRRSVDVAGARVELVTVVTLAITGLVLAALVLVLTRTRWGLELRASAEDPEMVRLLGARPRLVVTNAVLLAAGLAAVAGILLVARTGSATPDMGVQPVLFGLVATVVGGMGSLRGAVLAGLALGATSVALQTALPLDVRALRDAFLFAAVFAFLWARPQGLVTTPSRAT